MAQRDKYDFQQISQDWGAVEYKDVPSYSKTSVGTTGDAYLIRQFLKQFFPFLKTTVNKGNTSVRVKVQEIEINFISQQGGVRTNFLLNAAKLDEILGPLFEGQGFDGMTDSSYSKPLPKMYNDEGFEVSYGYIYLFVDPENFKYRYTIDLNTPDKTKKQDVLVFRSEVAGDGSQLKIELPLKTYNYIRNEINNTISNSASKIDPLPNQEKPNSPSRYNISSLGQAIVDFLAENEMYVLEALLSELTFNKKFRREDILDEVKELIQNGLVSAQIKNGYTVYVLTSEGKKYLNYTDVKKSNEGEKAMSLFVAKNLDILKDMEQNAPELLDVLSKGLQLITNLGKGNTAELAPFTPLKNQQELEDQLKEEDFDISESDLSELDLTGLEDDLELNDDELGNLDLTEFDELTDFVNTELIPSKEARDYAVLKTVQLKSVVNNSITTNEILTSLNDRAEEKYTDQNILDLEQRDFLYKSNGWNLTTKGEDFIDEYELKNKQDSVVYPLINAQKKIDIDNLDIYQKEIIRVLSPINYFYGIYPTLTVVQIFEKIDNNFKFTYRVIDARADLEILKIMGLVEEKDQQFNLVMSDEVKEVVEKLNEEKSKSEKLSSTEELILLDLRRMNTSLSGSDIQKDITSSSKTNLTLPKVFTMLSQLKNKGLVEEINTQYSGVQWKITPLGDEYVDKLPKTGGEYREEKKRQKIEEDFGSLDYDYYLVAKILNDTMGMLTAGTVTTILQQKFNKKPKWQEVDVLLKLRSLKKYGLALEDIQNSTEYFEISAYGEDVVEYLSEQESKGLYPKSKPTQQTAAVRPSPTESATLNAVGTIKKGNDGNNWEVKESSKGVKRWVKMK